ncbi:winged helix-turn-helix domain-containing protein [Peptostreptococcus faecalis]|uniref:winged helix-turn-helix domain-containing protein n=1 Tax=Peptostreptococcus faecalis TaxID=2045015 RepID=UPI002E8E4943|nr:winged helix-turn-helix domain-containing protein [Peptostreptococcus faecalis]
MLNIEQKKITLNNNAVELTAKEYMIMELLINNKEKVFTKSNLYETIWGEDFLGDDNAIKSHISNIRAKLKSINSTEEYIETVWGLGYRLFAE